MLAQHSSSPQPGVRAGSRRAARSWSAWRPEASRRSTRARYLRTPAPGPGVRQPDGLPGQAASRGWPAAASELAEADPMISGRGQGVHLHRPEGCALLGRLAGDRTRLRARHRAHPRSCDAGRLRGPRVRDCPRRRGRRSGRKDEDAQRRQRQGESADSEADETHPRLPVLSRAAVRRFPESPR